MLENNQNQAVYVPFWVYDNPAFSWVENQETSEKPHETASSHILYKQDSGSDIAIKGKSIKNRIFLNLSKLSIFAGVLFLLVSYGPSIWFRVSGREATENTIIDHSTEGVELKKQSNYQPAFDKSLPIENSIRIPSLSIEAEIQESPKEHYEEALKKGVWRVNYFGTPYSRELPTILAAHRYGYLKWSTYFRLHSSFYKLPELKEGDTIELIWRQRKYTYAVYKSEEGSEITDYNADLILYTCYDLNSDIRIFKYAKLLEI